MGQEWEKVRPVCTGVEKETFTIGGGLRRGRWREECRNGEEQVAWGEGIIYA